MMFQVVLSDRFKLNYEMWLKREVYKANIDWDQLIKKHDGETDEQESGDESPNEDNDHIVPIPHAAVSVN